MGAVFEQNTHRTQAEAAACGAGEKARLVCNLAYAAPEIVHAAEGAKRAVVVDSAADIWALGVIAFELLAGELTFPQFPQRGDIAEAKRVSKLICDSVSGRTELPWEGGGAEARRRTDQLRALKRTVRCLNTYYLVLLILCVLCLVLFQGCQSVALGNGRHVLWGGVTSCR